MVRADRMKAYDWTNKSVRLFAQGQNPLEVMRKRTREIVLKSMDQGWSGPPFDPFELSDFLKIKVFPRSDIPDARTAPLGESDICIEYNPTRPHGRLRYSVAHEIAHTLFPDCAVEIRNRSMHRELTGDEWQLEILCNVGAAEILMPIGSLQSISLKQLTIDHMMKLRERFHVSMEAILIRSANVSETPCAVFVASIIEKGQHRGRYRIDYVIPSRSWWVPLNSGQLLSKQTVVSQSVAIGYTAKGDEVLIPGGQELHLECVGIPGYPGSYHPRVAGLITGSPTSEGAHNITYLVGDSLDPRGNAHKVVVHVVNDATPNWGGRGFALALKQKWPEAQRQFRAWVQESRAHLKLGQVHFARVSEDVTVASMVCQKGYGPSARARIRYWALAQCLLAVASNTREMGGAAHMPRIGTGQAGGEWPLVEELITSTLISSGVPTFVYDLPGRVHDPPIQPTLFSMG
jgi:O-acetyl-ADP-ribose deacetylase (regulator of RNase III)